MKNYQKIIILLIVLLICIPLSSKAQDSLSVAKQVKHKPLKDPMRASMLAVSFPGLGQIYNRKYWKIPLVYAGFGGLVYSVGFNSSNYTKYMKAYQDFTDANPETTSYLDIIKADPATYDPVLYPDDYDKSNAQYYQDGMLRLVDYYKRYRDLSYIGIAGWYLISILDANVDASLFNYDISDNLDITVVPMQLTLPGGMMGAGLNVRMVINF